MSLVSLRLTFRRDLLRVGPVWTLLAGVVLAGRGEVSAPTVQIVAIVILALFLVEVLWGGLWEHLIAMALMPTRSRGEVTSPAPLPSSALPPLPYAQPTAPFTRLWLWLRDENEGSGRDAGLGLAAILLAMAGLVAIMILVSQAGSLAAGEAALAASVAVTILALLGAFLCPAFPSGTQLLAAAVGVGWPWLLGLNLLAWQAPSPTMWLLMAGFTLLSFVETSGRGEVSSPSPSPLSPAAALACYGLILAALVLAAAPWGPDTGLGMAWVPALLPAGLAALVFSVPAWRLLRGNPAGIGRWHLLALGVTTLSLVAISP